MKKLSRYAFVFSVVFTFVYVSAAQEKPAGSASVPKVLQITREFVKPTTSGLAHEKTESAFVDEASEVADTLSRRDFAFRKAASVISDVL